MNISADRARPGDQIILSGYIGDHGMAIMSQRENLEFEGAIASDCASLHGLVAAMLSTPGKPSGWTLSTACATQLAAEQPPR